MTNSRLKSLISLNKEKVLVQSLENPTDFINKYLCTPNETNKDEKMYFTGIIIAICTFLTIGIWHPIVIKTEYYWGTRPWIVYLLIGLASLVAALFIENTIISAVVGVFGASALWGIGELFQQKKRVEKGWFPKNPNRRY